MRPVGAGRDGWRQAFSQYTTTRLHAQESLGGDCTHARWPCAPSPERGSQPGLQDSGAHSSPALREHLALLRFCTRLPRHPGLPVRESTSRGRSDPNYRGPRPSPLTIRFTCDIMAKREAVPEGVRAARGSGGFVHRSAHPRPLALSLRGQCGNGMTQEGRFECRMNN